MYLPRHFVEEDTDTLHALIESYPFGALIVPRAGDAPEIAHVPFLLDRARGERGLLSAHVARANPIWRAFDGARAVAVFQGPHAYVSPRFYAGADQVPTWNYAVVHAHGAPRVLDEAAALDLLRRLSAEHERGAERPWTPDDLSPGRLSRLAEQIVAFEIEIDRLEGKLKLSQNRRPEDREGAIRGLAARGRPEDLELVRMMDEAAERARAS